MTPLKHSWTIQWAGVDRRTLYAALRVISDELAHEAIAKASPMFDDDYDTCVASVVVLSLPQALEILAETKDVPCDWGVHLHILAEDELASFGASLGSGEAYSPTGASVSYARHKTQNKAALDKLIAIEDASNALRDLLLLRDTGEA